MSDAGDGLEDPLPEVHDAMVGPSLVERKLGRAGRAVLIVLVGGGELGLKVVGRRETFGDGRQRPQLLYGERAGLLGQLSSTVQGFKELFDNRRRDGLPGVGWDILSVHARWMETQQQLGQHRQVEKRRD
jgi:hypothetical protein